MNTESGQPQDAAMAVVKSSPLLGDLSEMKLDVRCEQEKQRQKINDNISEYVDKNCPECYAMMTREGRLHLDWHWKRHHLIEVMKIAGFITV